MADGTDRTALEAVQAYIEQVRQRTGMQPQPTYFGGIFGGFAGLAGAGIGMSALRGKSIYDHLADMPRHRRVTLHEMGGNLPRWQFKNGHTAPLEDDVTQRRDRSSESLPEGTLRAWDRGLGCFVYYAR